MSMELHKYTTIKQTQGHSAAFLNDEWIFEHNYYGRDFTHTWTLEINGIERIYLNDQVPLLPAWRVTKCERTGIGSLQSRESVAFS